MDMSPKVANDYYPLKNSFLISYGRTKILLNFEASSKVGDSLLAIKGGTHLYTFVSLDDPMKNLENEPMKCGVPAAW